LKKVEDLFGRIKSKWPEIIHFSAHLYMQIDLPGHFVRSTTLDCLVLIEGKSMQAEELRARQAPLKEQYRGSPDTAMITLSAQGNLDDGITCSVETGKALVQAGLHPATGGDGFAACSGDMLLQALVACAGVTLRGGGTAHGGGGRGGPGSAPGERDFRGTLGVSKEAPVGFADIRLNFDLDSDATPEELHNVLRLTERYCVVYQTLRNAPPIAVTMGESH
jgi:uncharacterized OsmC-like protein